MKKSFRFRRTTVITAGLIGCLIGLRLSHFLDPLQTSWLIVPIVLIFVSWRKLGWPALLSIFMLGLISGWLRGQVFLERLQPYEELYGERLVVRATADADAVYGNRAQLSFDASKIAITKPFELKLPGRLKIEGYGEPAVYRGDIVEVEGKLFPAGGSRQGKMSFAQFKVLGRSDAIIETLRLKFIAGMQSALPEPHASFSLGLLVGQRSTIPEEVAKTLSIVGLTHIIAVSGYNLTIIVRGTRRLLSKRSKYQSTLISLILIGTFLLVTGFSASIVRASIVSMLSLFAWYYGRTFRPILLLSLAAVLTATWNPVYIWSDIGWYLSFLAFFGVLILAPLITKRLYGDKKQPRSIAQIVIESISAQIMTLPLILYIFQEMSLVALLSNAIIVPLVPFAMILSLLAGLAGMVVPAISGWIAWPANILLTYMLDIVALLSRVPHALVQRTLSWVGMMVLYGVLGFVTIVLWRRLKAEYVKITDKNIIE